MTLPTYPMTYLHQRLIDLSTFRFVPPGYLSKDELQRILMSEWCEDGNKKKIRNPIKWIGQKAGMKSSKSQIFHVIIYNEWWDARIGIRTEFFFTRQQGTKNAIIHGNGLTLTPYTYERGIITDERISTPFTATPDQLFDLVHSLIPTVSRLFRPSRTIQEKNNG